MYTSLDNTHEGTRGFLILKLILCGNLPFLATTSSWWSLTLSQVNVKLFFYFVLFCGWEQQNNYIQEQPMVLLIPSLFVPSIIIWINCTLFPVLRFAGPTESPFSDRIWISWRHRLCGYSFLNHKHLPFNSLFQFRSYNTK